MEATGRGSRWVPWGLVGLLYLAIQAVFWAPAWRQLGTMFIGEGIDNYVFVWNAWWLKQSLLTGHNPLFCDLQYAPHGTPLAFHCLTAIPSLIMVGLEAVCSVHVAFNVVVLGTCVFGGMCAFALARHLTRDTLAAAVGGAAFMISPFMSSKLVGHLNLSLAALLPLYTLLLIKAVEDPGRRCSAWLAVSFVLILFSSEQTLVFAANVTVWYWAFRMIRHRAWWGETKRFVRALAPTMAIGLAWGGVLVYYIVRYSVYPEPHGGAVLSPEPLSYVLPVHTLSVWRGWFTSPDEFGVVLRNLEFATYLGWLVFPLAMAGFWLRRRDGLVLLMACLFICALIISFGPVVQWHREKIRILGVGIHLPMDLYRQVPLLGMIGQSGRYMVIAYMAMAVGVAAALTQVRSRWPGLLGNLFCVLALGAVGLDYAYRPVLCGTPTSPLPPGPGRVLDFRIDPARSVYRQTIDARPMVGGYVSRPPAWIEREYRSLPGISWLFLKPADRGLPPSPELLNEALQRLKVEYIWVGRDAPERRVLETAGWHVSFEDWPDVLLTQ